MQEVRLNLWDCAGMIRCITTNGDVKKNSECVMGRGNALEAKNIYPGLARLLGQKILDSGNVPHILITEPSLQTPPGPNPIIRLVSFPVKHHWYEQADLTLIAESARRLLLLIPPDGIVMIPRPGCGNGGLKWDDVKVVLRPILRDDRFLIAYKKGEI